MDICCRRALLSKVKTVHSFAALAALLTDNFSSAQLTLPCVCPVPAKSAIEQHLTKLYETRDQNFGNGRDVRNLFEKLVNIQANRVAALEAPTTDDLLLLTKEDVEALSA